MMNEASVLIVIVGGFVFVGSAIVAIVCLITWMTGLARNNKALQNSSLKVLLGCLVVGMIGFSVCTGPMMLDQ